MSGTVANGRRLSNMDIAVLALYQLGGVGHEIHLEEVACQCHRIAPERFGWELPKFSKFPDKKAVYYALKDAEKPKHGCLVGRIGSRAFKHAGQKFYITEQGAKWIKVNEPIVSEELHTESKVARTQAFQHVRRNVDAVKDKPAFRRFRADGGVNGLTVYDLIDFLGISYETSPTAIRKQFSTLRTKAELTDDAEVSQFLLACEQAPHFARILNIEMA